MLGGIKGNKERGRDCRGWELRRSLPKGELMRIITLSGKAKQVFRFLELLARFKGEVTLGEMAK